MRRLKLRFGLRTLFVLILGIAIGYTINLRTLHVFTGAGNAAHLIVQGRGIGPSLLRVPITGNETVLDAIAQIGGVPGGSAAKMWIGRPAPSGTGSKILPISWEEITRSTSTATNYQLLPGDRLVVSCKPDAFNSQ